MNVKIITSIIVLGLLAGIGGYVLQQSSNQPKPVANISATPQVGDILNKRRPDFELKDVDGVLHKMSKWDGNVILLNFWATWCPPCRREMPAFVELKNKYGAQGFEVIGVAIDQPDEVEAFGDTLEVNYPILVGEKDAIEAGKQYGNHYGQLPYSLIIDRKGFVRFIRKGELTFEDAEKVIKTLL